MTGKERLKAALRGEAVDRVPIWLREGFELDKPIPEESHFTQGWKNETLYKELFNYVVPYADYIKGWGIGSYVNRFMMIPPRFITTKKFVSGDVERIEGSIQTPRGKLVFIDEVRRGLATSWHIKTPVQTIEELKMFSEIPFDFNPEDISQDIKVFHENYKKLGDKGIMRFNLPSPIVAISRCMDMDTFLEMSITEKELFHELLEEITRRMMLVVDAVFSRGNIDTMVNLGGAEQCTPPLMSPMAYDEFVVPYDGKIVAQLKKYNIAVNNHCHGKVKHALKCMVEMGIDATDPIEPPPQGDLTFAEAREIAGDKLTLLGNLEWSELEHSDAVHIRRRVREMLKYGNKRLILAASAGPISAITPKLVENYIAWIETALELG